MALNDGTIDVVASDHGPFAKDWKERGLDNIWKASMGAPVLDTFLPLMLTHVNRGLISLQTLTKVASKNVAKIFDLYPRKGTLQVGSDADLVIIDPKKKEKLSAEKFYTKAKEIALIYNGIEVEGMPVATLVNGVEVMREGQVMGKPGTGKFSPPNAYMNQNGGLGRKF
jgi:dihydroorotase-like cyclic amidohydrolase